MGVIIQIPMVWRTSSENTISFRLPAEQIEVIPKQIEFNEFVSTWN